VDAPWALWDLDPGKLPGPLGKLGKKELHLWVGAWLKDRLKKRRMDRAFDGTRHLLFAVCDHYEPLHGQGTTTANATVDAAAMDKARARVATWRTEYPKLGKFRDSDGRPPRHSFFYPGEQYYPELLEPVAELCQAGFGEVEVHLHHDGDTREALRASLELTLTNYEKHGLVPRAQGKRAWAFIHGNWCLANARRDRRYCGVDDEMQLLYDLGCYADFTFPSAPDESQPGIVNSIYYPSGDVTQRRAYERGEPARVGTRKQDRLLMIEGPLALAMRPHSNKIRIESGALDWADPPSWSRLRTWVRQRVVVEGRPDWVFVKVHTHGAPEKNAEIMLGGRNVELHEELAKRYADGKAWKLHYVSAREMFNVARAAMDGKTGSPDAYFDYEVPRPPRLGVTAK
jgi:hypothetical protein